MLLAGSERYATVVIDPPWDMGRMRGGAWGSDEFAGPVKRELPYPPMKLDAIAALPVDALAAAAAHLYVWTVDRYIEATYTLARGWGFTPNTLLTWAKTPMGLGPGGAFAQTSEHILFATRGPVAPAGRRVTTWWNWPRPRNWGACHSNKPDAFLDEVEQVSRPPRLEMFARRGRLGWDYWGDESLGTVELPEAAA